VAARTRPKKDRLPHGSAKERILDAAEALFATSGLDGVSFRDLATAAGVSLSATHYYFDSKHAVLAEVFGRSAKAMTERRTALLAEATAGGTGAVSLETILEAFLRPAFEVTRGDRNDVFNRLRARLAVEQSEVTREIVSAAFDRNDAAFIAVLVRTLPAISQEAIYWRFHFLVGAMLYTMSDSGQLSGLSAGLCSPLDTERALSAMIVSFAALFRSPEHDERPAAEGVSAGSSLADAKTGEIDGRA
jgi:AcrR family transcriptional regulator